MALSLVRHDKGLAVLLSSHILARGVHRQVDDVAVWDKGCAQAVFHQACAVDIHCVAFPCASPLRVCVRT